MLHLRKLHACLAQAVSASLRRDARPMLDTTEALLLGSRDQLSVAHERCRGVRVEGIEAENDQARLSHLLLMTGAYLPIAVGPRAANRIFSEVRLNTRKPT